MLVDVFFISHIYQVPGNSQLYIITHVPLVLQRIGCMVSGPIAQHWDSLISKQIAKARAGGNDVDMLPNSQLSSVSSSYSIFTSHLGSGTGSSQDVAHASFSGGILPVDHMDDSQSQMIRNSAPMVPFIEWSNIQPSTVGGADHGTGHPLEAMMQRLDEQQVPMAINSKRFIALKTLTYQDVNHQKDFLSHMDHPELAAYCFSQLECIRVTDESLVLARKALKTKSQQIRRLQGQIAKRTDELNMVVHGQSSSLEVVRTGRRLTWKTSMTLGLRKLMSIVSASAFPLTTLIDISRWTIIRCEINTWATLVGRTRAWYKIVTMLLIDLCAYWANSNHISFDLVPAGEVHDIGEKKDTPTPPTQWQSQDDAIRDDFGLPCFSSLLSSLTVKLNQSYLDWTGTVGSTFWSGDATNSSIWKRQKLQGLEVRSTLLVNRRALVDELYDQAFTIMKSMSLADFFLRGDWRECATILL